jgi:gliding motility-associated lipoprotein GldK
VINNMNMKKIILLSSVVALLSACGGSGNGELIGAQDRKNWNPTDPYGMVYIPQGSFNMGPSDQDVPFANVSQSKTVSVGAFYMDETEITNNEYRQFTTWVRDSILRKYLAKRFPEDYALIIKKGDLEGDFKMDSQDDEVIDWSKKIQWDDESVRGVLEDEMFIPGDERLDGHKEFDTREYVYRYQVLDIQSASAKANREARHGKAGAEGERDREKFLSYIKLKIYPDTLTWNHDYSYSFNDPFTKNYFWHPAFDDYPVVGVNWKQANAFANWRTKMMNTYLRKIKQPTLPDFRLPTESEWEYASRGGLDASPYPWGGPYTRNLKGCFLANFKPLRGNYVADGGLKTIKTASYNPNGYGLYDMAGNVAEWTSNAYDESSYSYSHDMNSDYHYNAETPEDRSQEEGINEVLKRKSIRGGSWKDIAYFIQTSSRTFEYQDTAKSYIGFRCAVDFLGRDKKDFE